MKNIVARIASSRLGGNVISQFLLTGFSHIVPLLLIPFLVSTIGIEKYGVISIAIGITFYFQVIVEWGFDLSNVEHVISHRENPAGLSEVVGRIMYAKILLLLIVAPVYIGMLLFFSFFEGYTFIYILAFFRLIGGALSLNWLFRSLEDMRYVTYIVLGAKLLVLLPIFGVVHTPDDYWIVLCFYVAEVWGGTLAFWCIAKRRYSLTFSIPSWYSVVNCLSDSFPFFVTTFLSRLYQYSNVNILGIACGEAAAGVYSVAEKLHNVYNAFVMPMISHVLYPYFSRVGLTNFRRKIGYALVVNLIILLIFGGAALLALPYVFPAVYENLYGLFGLFLLSLLFAVPAELLGYPSLGVMGYSRHVTYTTVLASVLYLLLVLVLLGTNMISGVVLTCVLVAVNAVLLVSRLWVLYVHEHKIK